MKNLRTLNEDVKRYYMWIGFGMSKGDLMQAGEQFEFQSSRERMEFREILAVKNPKDMTGVKWLFEAYAKNPKKLRDRDDISRE